jgi:hypothetical protein
MTRGVTFTETVTLVVEQCCACGVAFAMPKTLRDKLADDPNRYFYCPNGHAQHYAYSKEKKLREEIEIKLRQKENELWEAQAKRIELEGEIKNRDNKLKRLTNGVCPCCNRSFHNLQRHMKKQHPEEVSKIR